MNIVTILRSINFSPIADLFDDTILSEAAGKEPALYLQSILACIQTFGSLPGTHGRSSVVSTLRGNGSLVKNPNHGLLAGNKKITNQHLNIITDAIVEFLEGCDAAEGEELITAEETDEMAEDWISAANRTKNKTFIQEIAQKLITAMAAENIQPLVKPATTGPAPMTNRQLRAIADKHADALQLNTDKVTALLVAEMEKNRGANKGAIQTNVRASAPNETTKMVLFVPATKTFQCRSNSYHSRGKDGGNAMLSYEPNGWFACLTDRTAKSRYGETTYPVWLEGTFQVLVTVLPDGTCKHKFNIRTQDVINSFGWYFRKPDSF